jgi:hypothetical protein
MVQAILGNKLQALHVIHKVSGQHYDRTDQYKLLSLNQTSNGFPSYFWEGFLIKDPNVVMTGHLWQNNGVWLYDEHQAFRDGSPGKLATPPVMCQSITSGTANASPPGEDDHESEPAPQPLDRSPAPPPPAPPPTASTSSTVGCSDPEVNEAALKVHLNSTMGHIDGSILQLMVLDNVRAMGISNNEGSKKCRAQYTCDMDRAKQIEKGLYGQHPLTRYCYGINQSSDSGNPVTINFTVAPDGNGDGGWIVHNMP